MWNNNVGQFFESLGFYKQQSAWKFQKLKVKYWKQQIKLKTLKDHSLNF